MTRPLHPGVAQVTKPPTPLGPRMAQGPHCPGPPRARGLKIRAGRSWLLQLWATLLRHGRVSTPPRRAEAPLFVHRAHLTQPPTSPTACSGNLRSSRVGAVICTPGPQVPRPGDRPGRARKPQDGRSSPDFRESKQHTCSVPKGAIPSLFLVLGLAARSGSPSRPDDTKSAGRQCLF